MNPKKRKDCVCINCNIQFYPQHNMTGKYCSNKCQMDYQSKLKYQSYLENPEKYNGQTNMTWIKKYILTEQKHTCAICEMQDNWNDKLLIFILDHIDGHANNNYRVNLRLICPNCDSQLDTYKSKNKNSDRTYYHSHYR